MDDRNRRFGQRDYYGRSSSQDYRSGSDYASSAGDYGARARDDRRTWRDEGDRYDRGRDYRGQRSGWDEGASDDYRGGASAQRGYGADYRSDRRPDRDRGLGRPGYDEDRGFLERAGDEIRSWFGDDEAERRRERDQRYDARAGRGDRGASDPHYHSWRRQRIAELDRDYDEYQRENSQRFHNEFTSWRNERQGQRDSLGRVQEHMEVVGSDGSHVGTVDKVRGDRILLTKNDSDAGGHHHSIPSRWIQSVDDKVTLRKTADEAKAHWRDEERSGALFGDDDRDQGRHDWSSGHNLNRSFSGTY